MPIYTYREDSGFDEKFAAADDDGALQRAEEMLREGDWGQSAADGSFRVRASVGRIAAEADGTEDVRWLPDVTVQFDPAEPKCPGRDGHDWDDGQAYGSDHGGVRWTGTCKACGLKRVTDTGATDRGNGEQMTSVSYEADPGFCRIVSATAALTTISEQRPGGWYDVITIQGEDGDDIESIDVESSEDEEPYLAALAAAGWTVTGTTPARQGIHGGDAWTVTTEAA